MHNLVLHVLTKKSIIIFRPYSAAHQVISGFGTLSVTRSRKVERKGLDKALKILDLIVPSINKVVEDACHHRLIQGCMQDLLKISRPNCSELVKKTTSWRTSIFVENDDLMLFLALHKRGISPDATILSSIVSSCGTAGDLDTGVQLHAFMFKVGFDKYVHVGSSLISLYSKCGQLGNAYQAFENMPVKNIVTWTVIITGYAQHWQVETCLHLFILMRRSMLKPNDFTFASLLSACTSSAALGLGRSVQCLEMRMGFDSYNHVSNALISMYAKCGSMDEARYVFEKMPCKDMFSWNSMIFGYAQYGLAEQALDLLKDMDEHSVDPDAISFLGILSLCRHVGLVEQGHQCLNTMLDRGIKPELDHYSCIVDLLGRAGLLEEALDFIEKMPIPPNAVIWGSLLSSCRVHGNVWIGIQAAESRLLLEPGCAATHVQLANLYASAGCWKNVAEVRKLMKERCLKKSPGYSWIEISNKVHRFKAEDGSKTRAMLTVLDSLICHMKFWGHMPVIVSDVNE